MEAIMEVNAEAVVDATNLDVEQNVEESVVDNTSKKRYDRKRTNALRFDYETGYVLLRVSSSTEPKKLGGAIFKNFKDGCKALVVSFIGKDATVQALKGISVANVYLENSNDEDKGALIGKTLCISPKFYTFETEIGDATTTKIIIHAVDSNLIN